MQQSKPFSKLLLGGVVSLCLACQGTNSTTSSSGGETKSGGNPVAGGRPTLGGSTVMGGQQNSGGMTTQGGSPHSEGGTQLGGALPAVLDAGTSSTDTSVQRPDTATMMGGSQATGGATSHGGAGSPTGHYQMENLDRGVVAVKVSGGMYIGWRMFGYEYSKTKPANIAYQVYKGEAKLALVTDSTNYLDPAGAADSTYSVAAVMGGIEGARSSPTTTWAQNFLRIPLMPPSSLYQANDASPGDLDGDGKLDLVLKWDPANSKDNSQKGVTDHVFIDGLTLSGKRLWRIDLGPNIRAGAHYTQMSVYDFDGDGKAELAVKTAPGTKDGTGAYLSNGPAATDNDSEDYRNSSGYVLSGPEYLTVFAGDTGKELATVAYPVPRGNVGEWGDDYGNRVDRFNGGVAFISDTGNGKTATGRPSIIQQRGYYTRMTMSAYNFRDGKLTKVWVFDSNASGNGAAKGQGNHQAMAGDADNDGAQEIFTGATTISSDGKLQCTTGLGHGDAMHIGELVVGKPLAVFSVHESIGGHDCHDAATCKLYINTPGSGDNGRGVADYVSMSDTTAATCSSGVGSNHCATGASTSSNAGNNFLIYWDEDEARELENDISISKSGGGVLLTATGCASNNGTKRTPTLTADLLGDWREELVLREADSSALRVYTTTAVTKRRIYTLMHDPTYRAQVSFENSSYNQPPHVGFHIGAGMADPPEPNIHVK